MHTNMYLHVHVSRRHRVSESERAREKGDTREIYVYVHAYVKQTDVVTCLQGDVLARSQRWSATSGREYLCVHAFHLELDVDHPGRGVLHLGDGGRGAERAAAT